LAFGQLARGFSVDAVAWLVVGRAHCAHSSAPIAWSNVLALTVETTVTPDTAAAIRITSACEIGRPIEMLTVADGLPDPALGTSDHLHGVRLDSDASPFCRVISCTVAAHALKLAMGAGSVPFVATASHCFDSCNAWMTSTTRIPARVTVVAIPTP